MQTTMTIGQAVQPSVLSTVETIVKNCNKLATEAAELRKAAARWLSANKEEVVCCACIPLFMAFWCSIYILAAVLQGGAV